MFEITKEKKKQTFSGGGPETVVCLDHSRLLGVTLSPSPHQVQPEIYWVLSVKNWFKTRSVLQYRRYVHLAMSRALTLTELDFWDP